MGIESILSKAYNAIKSNYSIALPAAIAWIPSAIFGLIFALAYSRIIKTYSFDKIMAAVKANPIGSFHSVWTILSPYVLSFTAVFLIAIAVYYYVRAIYPFIAKDINDGKPVSITNALKNAKSRFWALVATDIVLMLLIFASAAAGFALLIGVPIIGALIAIVGFIAFLIYLVPLNLVLTSVVVIGEKSGIAAIKESYGVIKNRKLYSWLFLIVVAIVSGLYLFAVSVLEGLLSLAIGSYATILTMVLTLFATAFIYISETLFYFELTGGLKPTEPPKKALGAGNESDVSGKGKDIVGSDSVLNSSKAKNVGIHGNKGKKSKGR